MGTLDRSIRRFVTLAAVVSAAAAGLVVTGATASASVVDMIVLPANSGEQQDPFDEGQGTGDFNVAGFADTGNLGACDVARYTALINWGDGKTSTGGLTCAVVTPSTSPTGLPATFAAYTVDGAHTYADSGTYNISVTATDTEDSKTATAQTDTVTVNDGTLFWGERSVTNLSGVEGQALAVTTYFDDSNASLDTSLTATIDWGDGSTSAGTVTENLCECEGTQAKVTGSHAYDAPATAGQGYKVTVTLKDDGGSTAHSTTYTASVTDAALTKGAAKTLTVANGTAASQVIGTFTDAAGAQAAAGDFTATIHWGDNATSSGSVTTTAAGAFSVSGSHAYSTGGAKAISAVVTDQEGATMTLTASATVPVLAQTGHPGGPSSPWLRLTVLLAGLLAAGLGLRLRLASPKR
jgi:hypothetical protein